MRARPNAASDGALAGVLTGSASSPHAKTFAIDGRRIFIASFNFDPRSAMLNAEMGVLVESPATAASLGRAVYRRDAMYDLRRGATGRTEWLEARENGGAPVHHREPGTSAILRARVRAMSWLPI